MYGNKIKPFGAYSEGEELPSIYLRHKPADMPKKNKLMKHRSVIYSLRKVVVAQAVEGEFERVCLLPLQFDNQ